MSNHTRYSLPNTHANPKTDANGYLALHHAVFLAAPPMLIESLVDANPVGLLTADPQDGCLPIHLCCEASSPTPTTSSSSRSTNANPGNPHVLASLKVLLSRKAEEQCQAPDVDGDLAIHRACYKRVGVEALELLCQAYPNAVAVSNKEGDRAVEVALKRDCGREVVGKLVERMKDIQGEGGKLPEVNAMAMWACKKKEAERVKAVEDIVRWRIEQVRRVFEKLVWEILKINILKLNSPTTHTHPHTRSLK